MAPDDMELNKQTLLKLDLRELEETTGEIHRRIAVALRTLGEQGADQPDISGMTARREVAKLAASLELAALTLAAYRIGTVITSERIDHHPAIVNSLMYAAPTIPALLQRIEQDRRLLTSLARDVSEHLDNEFTTPWGASSVRGLLIEAELEASVRCAIAVQNHSLHLET
jgi:pimeloyl-ACP methyl ester carboxylesterase